MKRTDLGRLSDAELEAAWNDEQATVAAMEHAAAVGRRSEPFAGLDRDGSPPRELLGNFARRAIVGIMPRKSMWPEIDRIDERIADLQRRHGEAQERVRDLLAQRANAPQRDADAITEWELAGRKGPKPEATAAGLDAEILDAEREPA